MRITIASGDASRAVPKAKQAVYVGGVLRKDIECHAITIRRGLSGVTAAFTMPRALFDSDSSFLRNVEIVVYVAHDGESFGTPKFRGMADSIDARLAVGADEIGFSALSWLGWMDRLQLGQLNPVSTANFRRFDRQTESLNNWTVGTMVSFAFGPLAYPEDWNALIALGNTSALSSGSTTQTMATDVEFAAATYHEFLGHELALAGSVDIRERFTDALTFLDFYWLGPDSSTNKTVRVAAVGEDPVAYGASVSELDSSEDLSGIYSRAICYTAAKRVVVTISTDPEEEEDLLVPAWKDATPYASAVLTDEETAVLADPESSIPGSATYVSGREEIFRVFRLPAALRNYKIDAALAVEDSTGSPVPTHAFRYKPTTELAEVDGIDGVQATGEHADDPTLLQIESIDSERMTFTLAAPAIEFVSHGATGAVPKLEWQRAQVYLTCSLSLIGREGGYDTGIRGTGTPDALNDSGLVLAIQRPDLEVSQFTSLGLGLPSIQEFGHVTYFDAATGAWINVNEATSIRDDRDTAMRIAEASLRARAKRRTTKQVTLEYLARGLNVGDSVRIDNGGTLGPPLQIQALVLSCSDDPKTIFVATDAIPEEVVLPVPGRRKIDNAKSNAMGNGFGAGGIGGATPADTRQRLTQYDLDAMQRGPKLGPMNDRPMLPQQQLEQDQAHRKQLIKDRGIPSLADGTRNLSTSHPGTINLPRPRG